MSVDQKQNVMIKNAEEERALLEKTIQESKDEKKADSSSSEEASSDSETGLIIILNHSILLSPYSLLSLNRSLLSPISFSTNASDVTLEGNSVRYSDFGVISRTACKYLLLQ